MRLLVERLALGQQTFSRLAWSALAIVFGSVSGAGCGGRSALDPGSAPSAGVASTAVGGGGYGVSQGAQSSTTGGSGGATGGASPGGGNAGGSTDVPEDTPKDIPAASSGSRLKAQFLSTPDGTAQFVGFFDSERAEACELRVMPDNVVWCIPTASRTDTFHVRDGRAQGSGAYSDADCTKPVTVDDASDCKNAPRTRYLITRRVLTTEGEHKTSCDDPNWEIRPLGDAIELATLYYRSQDGTCSGSPVLEQRFRQLGDPLSHAAFAAAHEQNRDMPSRLVVREWVGDDGSRRALGWYDTRRAEPCYLTRTSDDSTRCLPQAQGYGDYYDDAACTEPVVDISSLYARTDCRAAPLKYGGRLLGSESCSVNEQLFELGEPVPSGTDVLFGGGQCKQTWATASSDHPFMRLGAEVPAQRFEELRTVWIGPGRLRQERHANPEGFTLPATLLRLDVWTPPPRYADSERQEHCYFQKTEDGLSRCVPMTFRVDGWQSNETPHPPTGFSLDSSCQSPELSYLRRDYCAPFDMSAPESHYSEKPKAALTTVQPDSCGSFAALWAISAPHHPSVEPIYWSGNPPGAACSQLAAGGIDYYAVVGERISRTTFQAAVLITEQ